MKHSKAAVLAQIVALCNEFELLPSDACHWIERDLLESQALDSMRLLQLEALIQEEFGIRIAREEIAAGARTLDAIAERIAVGE